MHGAGRVRQHRGMQNQNRPIGTGGRSSVDRLPDTLREAVDRAIADGATIDEITAHIRAGGEDCSRSAVGRYSKNVRDLIRRQRETDRTVKAWVQELGERPEGRHRALPDRDPEIHGARHRGRPESAGRVRPHAGA